MDAGTSEKREPLRLATPKSCIPVPSLLSPSPLLCETQTGKRLLLLLLTAQELVCVLGVGGEAHWIKEKSCAAPRTGWRQRHSQELQVCVQTAAALRWSRVQRGMQPCPTRLQSEESRNAFVISLTQLSAVTVSGYNSVSLLL